MPLSIETVTASGTDHDKKTAGEVVAPAGPSRMEFGVEENVIMGRLVAGVAGDGDDCGKTEDADDEAVAGKTVTVAE